MLAHLFKDRDGRWAFSGYGACGDPRHAPHLVVDVGRMFQLTFDGQLYLTGPGKARFSLWTPAELVQAARLGWFGFSIRQTGVAVNEAAVNEAIVKRLLNALKIAVKVADEAHDHWDADRDSKVGKYLTALSGHLPRYRADVDELHAAIAAGEEWLRMEAHS